MMRGSSLEGDWNEIVQEAYSVLINGTCHGIWNTPIHSLQSIEKKQDAEESQLFIRSKTDSDTGNRYLELSIIDTETDKTKARLWVTKLDASSCEKYVEGMFRKGSSLRQHLLQLIRALLLSKSSKDSMDRLLINLDPENPNCLVLHIPHKYQTIQMKGKLKLELVVDDLPKPLLSLLLELHTALLDEKIRQQRFPVYVPSEQFRQTTKEHSETIDHLALVPGDLNETGETSATMQEDVAATEEAIPTLSRTIVGKKRKKDLVSGRRVGKRKKGVRLG